MQLTTMAAGDLLALHDQGAGIVTLESHGQHAMTISAGRFEDDPVGDQMTVWGAVCAECGFLGSWRNVYRTIRFALDH